MTTYTNYANFNTITLQGRVSNCEIRSGKNGSFLSVTIISTLAKDGPEMSVQFTDSGDILDKAERGYLVNGQQVTLTGRIGAISEVYQDKDGNYQMRKRPQVTIAQPTILMGGLGAKPKSEAAEITPANATKRVARRFEQPSEAPLDEAPAVQW